jgi:hypothetical protein
MANTNNVVTLPPPATAHLQLSQAESLDDLDHIVRVAFIRGMRAKAWTIEKVARLCFVHVTTVSRWLSGQTRIPASAFAVVCGISSANENSRAA